MKKLILLSIIILIALITKAQRIEATVSAPIVTYYEIGATFKFKKISFNVAHSHYKTLDKMMAGLGYRVLGHKDDSFIEFGVNAGRGNKKSAFDIYTKAYIPLSKKMDFIIHPRYTFDKLGNYPEMRIGIALKTD